MCCYRCYLGLATVRRPAQKQPKTCNFPVIGIIIELGVLSEVVVAVIVVAVLVGWVMRRREIRTVVVVKMKIIVMIISKVRMVVMMVIPLTVLRFGVLGGTEALFARSR